MAIVPRARHQAPTIAPQQVVPIQAGQTGAGQLAKGLGDIGTSFQILQEEIDTATAKQADSQFSDEVRKLLYEDGEGFMNRLGSNAINSHKSVSDALKQRQDAILSNLNGAARRKAQSAIEGRYQGALTRVDNHISGQRRTFLNETANARVKSAINDAIFDPLKTAESIKIAVQEAIDAGNRNGQSPEVTKLKIAEAQTQIHSGIVKRIAAQSPIEAMRYLQDNKKKMLGSEVARLTGQLAPAVKEFKGRQAGRDAFKGGAILKGFETHERAISGKIRSIPVSKDYQLKVSSVVRQLGEGYDIKVISGAQPQKGSGGRRTGSTRHDVDHGGAGHTADLVLTRNGKEVKPGDDPALYERFFALAGAKFTGMGHYAWGIHVGGGKPAFWGPNGSAGTASARFAKAAASGRINRRVAQAHGDTTPAQGKKSGIRSIIDIADPDERAAALREYKLLAGIQAKESEAQRDKASDAAFKLIEGGGNVDDLPIDFRQNLGREEMSALRSYQDKLASGEKIETDPEHYIALSKAASETPDAFTKLNPIEWRDKLDDGDFSKFVDLQRTIRAKGREEAKKKSILVDAPTISSLRSAASAAIRGAGLNIKDDPKQIAAFEREIVQWADAFTRAGNKKPTPIEINEKINQMLTPVVLDPGGFRLKKHREQEGPAFSIDYDGNPLEPDDDLTLRDVRSANIEINGVTVGDDMLERFIGGFTEAMKRNPTAQEVIDGLVASGVFQ